MLCKFTPSHATEPSPEKFQRSHPMSLDEYIFLKYCIKSYKQFLEGFAGSSTDKKKIRQILLGLGIK